MTSFAKQLSNKQISHEYTSLEVVAAKKIGKNVDGKTEYTFKEVAKAKTDVLKATLTSSELGQQLTFSFKRGGTDDRAKDLVPEIVATFTMKKDFSMSMVCTDEFTAIKSYTYKPLITTFPGIESEDLSGVFAQWLCTETFFEHLKIISSKGGYTPELVKMLILYISYQDVKEDMLEKVGKFTADMVISLKDVAEVFKMNMMALKADIPKMSRHYSTELALPATTPSPAIVEAQSITDTIEVVETTPVTVENAPIESEQPTLEAEVTTIEPEETIEVPADVEPPAEQTEEVAEETATDPDTAMLNKSTS